LSLGTGIAVAWRVAVAGGRVAEGEAGDDPVWKRDCVLIQSISVVRMLGIEFVHAAAIAGCCCAWRYCGGGTIALLYKMFVLVSRRGSDIIAGGGGVAKEARLLFKLIELFWRIH
jgi:hypothetical protein